MYTPYEDVPRLGVQRITDEEFSELIKAMSAKRRAEDILYETTTRILSNYGKQRYEDHDEKGLPKTCWNIIGHNIEKMTVVY